MNALEYYDIASDTLYVIRDYFLFACYTGLSFADLMNLHEGNVVRGEDGEKWLKLFRQKSNETTNLPLLAPALAIMDKYKDNPRSVINITLNWVSRFICFLINPSHDLFNSCQNLRVHLFINYIQIGECAPIIYRM